MALPTVITSAGLQPQAPADILAQIIAKVASTNPGYTANLPLSMIEDVSSTDVAAVVLADSYRVEEVNSITPFGANAFTIAQLGTMFGIFPGVASNTSVFVQFRGTPGFVIDKGFIVGDGTYQYVIQDGGIVGTDDGDGLGTSTLLFAVANQTGSWSVPAGTVQTVLSTVPTPNVLTVNNPEAGTPSEASETEESYRARVYQAGLATCGGTEQMLKTLLNNIAGVQARLVSVIQLPLGAGWEILCGGGDPFQIGYAIYKSGINLQTVVGSTMTITGITKANPGVATTALNHGLTTGDVISIINSNPSAWNAANVTVTVIDEKTFSYGVNTTGFATYVGNAEVTPNQRNISVSFTDPPDTYSVTYVNPPQQTVSLTLVWNTSDQDFVSANAIAQAGAPALANYINSIIVGQPINVFQMEEVFLAAVSSIIDPTLVTRMVFSVLINGVSTPPVSGTGIINGDPESFFFTSSAQMTITQG